MMQYKVFSDRLVLEGYLGIILGVILVEFSRPISISDPASAKLLAIREALSIFANSKWSKEYHLIMESDVNNVVYWIRRPHCSPVPFKVLVQCCFDEGKEISWEINLIDRDQNVAANKLAKSGINRRATLLNVWN
ncbi:hypothetical protein V6N11_054586 [Hibiscus sabdariffa]|uniref:RNase H type-1 domain-containing protein n=1 Tax=Hibiscus sabdariffa TaxID=183260 RepID=A0ABR2S578_9ROSI